jgi:excisionase family DNA binding protein
MSEAIETAVRNLVAAIVAEIEERHRAPDRMLSIPEAASRLGIARSTVYEAIAAGRLRSIKLGRRRLVPESALGELVRGER